MKTIELTQGKVTQVDDDIYEQMSQYKWCYTNGYASRRKPQSKPNLNLYLHRVVCPSEPGYQTVHLDGDKLNNQRSNLRSQLKTHGRQAVETRAASGFRGVTKTNGTYSVSMSINGKNKYLGRYADPQDAARAYDQAAREIHGQHAMLNFPVGHPMHVPYVQPVETRADAL